VKQFIRSFAVLLISAGLMQGVWAQFNVSGPGFLPDENGTNLDAPQASKIAPKVAAGTVSKDSPDCPEMVVIPAGSFVMGSDRWAEEKPPHKVTIRSFLIGNKEVTQSQWTNIMGSNPSFFDACGPNCPLENVSWNEVQQFIAKLNQKTGQKYRLPSEAEWEYAARAGTTTEWSFGNSESILVDYAWYGGNSGGKPQLVGQKLPNLFGLFDVHGNVWEIIQDCWHANYFGAPSDGSAWVTGCDGNLRVIRGGSLWNGADYLRSAKRIDFDRNFWSTNGIGFRLARDLE
jgi:formylglycine-generating enzyme required for sulfatase activity